MDTRSLINLNTRLCKSCVPILPFFAYLATDIQARSQDFNHRGGSDCHMRGFM